MAKKKYAEVTKNLPKTYGLEPDYQQRVDAAKADILASDPLDLAQASRRLILVKKEQDRIEEELSTCNLLVEAYRQIVHMFFEKAGVESINVDGRTVSVYPEPYPKIEDREAFRLWCLKNGYEREMVLNFQTAAALVKERLLAGEPEPDGITVTVKNKVGVYKG